MGKQKLSEMYLRIANFWRRYYESIEKANFKAIEAYKEYCYGVTIKTGTPRQKLDAEFMKLYELGLRDIEIGTRLQISPSTVGYYRRDSNLPLNKKNAHGNGQIKK